MQQIELHCKECNMRFFDYMVTGNDKMIVLQGISLKCARCKRILVLKKYTEGMLRTHSVQGKFRF